MAAYLWHYNYLTVSEFTAEQGHWMGRPGNLQVRVIGERDSIETVQIGGSAVVLVEGKLEL
jgi:trans-2,3-dihydro-3-hydroxyanthranilate isomerase